MQHCYNCDNDFSGNFCPICGQRAEVGRVGWKSIKDNVAILWGMDSRSLGYTLLQLLGRPGYLVRDYISGRRQVSFPPVKMLVIVCLFVVVFESVFHQVVTEVRGREYTLMRFSKYCLRALLPIPKKKAKKVCIRRFFFVLLQRK